MSEIKDKVKELKKLTWNEIKSLNFNHLKNNSNRDVAKLKKSVLNRGFFSPFMVWNDFVFDGTGRLQALKELEKEGVEIPDLPCLFVEANNLAEAKIYALQISSKHGEITQESLYEFTVDIPEVETLIDEVDFYEFDMEFRELEEVDYSDKNKEVDLENLGNESSLIFKFDHQTYLQILDYLNNAKEKLSCNTNEQTLLKLLSTYE